MTTTSSDLALEEYRALRATIRERGTIRFVIAPTILVAWAGVERIGRYLQTFYEEDGRDQPPSWEHVAMGTGVAPPPATSISDPLFSAIFAVATVLNLIGAVVRSIDTEVARMARHPAMPRLVRRLRLARDPNLGRAPIGRPPTRHRPRVLSGCQGGGTVIQIFGVKNPTSVAGLTQRARIIGRGTA